jgi:hypothetical protein
VYNHKFIDLFLKLVYNTWYKTPKGDLAMKSNKTLKENINYYVTPLSVILRTTDGYELTFKGCIEDKTYMSYDIYEEDGEVKADLRFVFACDGKSETYLYKGLDDSEPVIY